MKTLYKICLILLLLMNINIQSAECYTNTQLIIKYTIIHINKMTFPEYIYTDLFNNIIDPIYLTQTIFYNGFWVNNPCYIQHYIIDKTIYLTV